MAARWRAVRPFPSVALTSSPRFSLRRTAAWTPLDAAIFRSGERDLALAGFCSLTVASPRHGVKCAPVAQRNELALPKLLHASLLTSRSSGGLSCIGGLSS